MQTWRSIWRLGLMALLVIGASGCATYRTHPEFKIRQASIKSIGVMPTDIDVYRITFTGDKDLMHDLVPHVNDVAQQQLVADFESKGYSTRLVDMSDEALAQKPEVRASWHTTSELFEKTLGDIQKRRQKKFTYTLGSDINLLADYAGADALIFTKGEGLKKTGGEIAREVILSALFGSPVLPSETQVVSALIDGNTGDVLWLHGGFTNGDPAQDKRVKEALSVVYKPFPLSASKQAEAKAKRNREKGSGMVSNPTAASPITPVSPATNPG